MEILTNPETIASTEGSDLPVGDFSQPLCSASGVTRQPPVFLRLTMQVVDNPTNRAAIDAGYAALSKLEILDPRFAIIKYEAVEVVGAMTYSPNKQICETAKNAQPTKTHE